MRTLALVFEHGLDGRVLAKPAEAVRNQVTALALRALYDDHAALVRLLAEAAHGSVVCQQNKIDPQLAPAQILAQLPPYCPSSVSVREWCR